MRSLRWRGRIIPAAPVRTVPTWVLLTPALVVVLGLFGGGLALGALRSLDADPLPGQMAWSLAAWGRVLGDGGTWASFGLSLWIAGASTLLSVLFGVAVALMLRGAFRGRALASWLVQLNLAVPHLVGAVGILYLLSQSGVLARIAFAAGAIEGPADFPALIWDPWAAGIVLQYVWKEVPFLALVTLAALQGIGRDYEAAARSLGAGPARAFAHVTWPQIRPAVTGGAVIVFAFAFGAYEIPALLGASYPKAMPVLAWERFTDPDLARRPEAMALALLIAALCGALVLAGARGLRLGGVR
ncbi:ABC transporter permease [Wenxinia saemankumensis]|uniref:Putative spermidine/putrescine transport system permease protein n=1 Tax=Wenxinia saemankumensis TaxID=1447782 RepID=A0A1M6DRN3_9RHOB|nr:ABC transporter permease subunit [Wenxinia saemankumensis]SHI75871.1 putative spermidine/putrescine transport system permease protein [Wenxinia saemankumensis]